MTGSASKGRTAYYHYYHCNATCGYRINAEVGNDIFLSSLNDCVLSEKAAELFKTVIIDVYSSEYHSTATERKQYIERITALNNKVTKARELLLNDDIDAGDFKAIKVEAEREMTVLESKISDLQTSKMSIAEVEGVVNGAIKNLAKTNELCCKSDYYIKRKLIGSIYLEKFTFEDLDVRTVKKSRVFEFI